MMKWKQKQQVNLNQDLIDEFQLSPITAKLFSLRQVNTKQQLEFWLHATEFDLADPYLMHDMDKAIARINQAIDQGEKITIYGDYDADGITATSIMVEVLSILGADVHYLIPDRFKDGYGPSLSKYQQLVADGTKLIITVDNGVTGIDEVAYANSHGVDTIITDHHTIQNQLPAAYAVVHCNYPGQAYPFDDYCGAGVAYTIARALMDDPMPELLDLAMIGTIGDMVKVSGEGHIVVKRGLEVFNQTGRPGLRALAKVAGLHLGQADETDIGFAIAPRLNATGRLANAELAVELLLCDDEDRASEIAQEIEQLNNKRKELTQSVFADAMLQIQQAGYRKKQTLVLYNPAWHEGVLGLVANKVAEQTHKPVIMLTKNDEGLVKGSGRSSAGFNLFDALMPLKDELFEKFGGHDFACGLSLTEANIERLRDAFEQSYQAPSEVTKEFDFALNPSEATLENLALIKQAGPFGTDHPKPIFAFDHPEINELSVMGKDKSHLRLKVADVPVVGFGMAWLTSSLLPFVSKIFFELTTNTYMNKTNLQAMMLDAEFAAPKLAAPSKVIDLRAEPKILGFADRYLLFDEQNLPAALGSLGIDQSKISLVSDYTGQQELVTLLDSPRTKQELDQALGKQYDQLYLRFMLDHLPVAQLPGRDAFSQVIKYVYAHPGLKPNDYFLVAPYLGLDSDTVHFILRVFFQLKFVTIEQDRIVPVNHAAKQPLTNSSYYRAISAQINFISKLRTMPTKQLIDYATSRLK